MKHTHLSAYAGLVFVGITATAALLLEASLPVPQDIHFLLQMLWLGVAMGSLFVVTLKPATTLPRFDKLRPDSGSAEIPEWRDPDRAWMQRHPNELYQADEFGSEGTQL